MSRQFGPCDLCRKDIPGKTAETVMMLRANYIENDRRAYTLEYTLCGDCAKEFNEWINKKMKRKEVDTT